MVQSVGAISAVVEAWRLLFSVSRRPTATVVRASVGHNGHLRIENQYVCNAVPLGIEPRLADSKSAVMPLHYETFSRQMMHFFNAIGLSCVLRRATAAIRN